MELVLENLRLRLDADGFTVDWFDGADWLPTTTAASRPVDALTPSAVLADGYAGTGDGYIWRSRFSADRGGVRVKTVVTVERVATLAPAMVLWVAALDSLNDRQAHTWRQTILRAPTVNAGGLGGNDLPAAYLYDQATKTETICYWPPDQFTWAARRFCEWNLREVIRYRPDARYGLGLQPATPATTVDLEPGEYTFVWWFTQRQRDDVPSPWQAQRVLIDAVAPLLDPTPRLTPDAAPWSEMALGTLADLQTDDCWITVDGVTGLRAYVRDSSAVGRDKARGFELMTQLDVLHPLLVWARLTGNEPPALLVERLLVTLPHFDRALNNFVANGYPPRANDTFMDTWYFLENALIKLPWVAHLTDSEPLRAMFRRALQGASELAHNSRGLFPLFADAADWRMRGSLLNPGVGGLYAAGCVMGWQLFGERRWLEEAARALRTLVMLPPHLLTHEPQQLSFGAAAAGYLARLNDDDLGDDDWGALAADLVRLSLRMGDWGGDAAVSQYDPRGMFQACASLCYPAYKENVETLWPWAELLRLEPLTPALRATLRGLRLPPRSSGRFVPLRGEGGLWSGETDLTDNTSHEDYNSAFTPELTRLMASFANLGRCHNTAFFDAYLPAELRRGPCPSIPYEDVATAEFPYTATLGKELYGAGEVLWSALLFDALGQVDAASRDVLCLSLDVPTLDLSGLDAARDSRQFLLYNPASRPRRVTVTTAYGAREVAIDANALIRLSVSHV